ARVQVPTGAQLRVALRAVGVRAAGRFPARQVEAVAGRLPPVHGRAALLVVAVVAHGERSLMAVVAHEQHGARAGTGQHDDVVADLAVFAAHHAGRCALVNAGDADAALHALCHVDHGVVVDPGAQGGFQVDAAALAVL